MINGGESRLITKYWHFCGKENQRKIAMIDLSKLYRCFSGCPQYFNVVPITKLFVFDDRMAPRGYSAIARFSMPFHSGMRKPKTLSKWVQSSAEKRGRAAGVGNSSLEAGSMA